MGPIYARMSSWALGSLSEGAVVILSLVVALVSLGGISVSFSLDYAHVLISGLQQTPQLAVDVKAVENRGIIEPKRGILVPQHPHTKVPMVPGPRFSWLHTLSCFHLILYILIMPGAM